VSSGPKLVPAAPHPGTRAAGSGISAGLRLSAEPIVRSRGVLGDAANHATRRVSTLRDNDSDRAIRSRGRRSGSTGRRVPGRPRGPAQRKDASGHTPSRAQDEHGRTTHGEARRQPTAVLVGTLDTRGAEYAFVRDRPRAAGRAGIPQIVAPGALELINLGPRAAVPAEYDVPKRRIVVHNPSITAVRVNAAEAAVLGRLLAEKVDVATGPIAVLLPPPGVLEVRAARRALRRSRGRRGGRGTSGPVGRPLHGRRRQPPHGCGRPGCGLTRGRTRTSC
jgi:Uncharacterised protein family (UPF0261)